MNQSKLSAERARELLSYDPATGSLTWKVSRGRAGAGTPAGNLNADGYIQVGVDGFRYLAHRLIWLIQVGRWPEDLIDHKNGIRSDNREGNLREATKVFNGENQVRAPINSTTGLLGVTEGHGKFQAQIKTRGVRRYLGSFPTAEEAHQAYLTAKRQLHAGCTI